VHEDFKGDQRGIQTTGTSNRNDDGLSESNNPMLAAVRFSKTLSPYWTILRALFGFLGSSILVYTKVMHSMDDRVQTMIEKKTVIPFHDLKRLQEDHKELADDFQQYKYYKEAPDYKPPPSKSNRRKK